MITVTMPSLDDIARHDDRGFTARLEGPVVSWKRNRRGKGGHTFRDAKGLAYRKYLAYQFRQLARNEQLRAPVGVELVFVVGRPSKKPSLKSGTVPVAIWASGCEFAIPSTNGNDIDRLAGNVLDALSDSGMIGDDGWITTCRARKVYAARGDVAHLRIRVAEVMWVTPEEDTVASLRAELRELRGKSWGGERTVDEDPCLLVVLGGDG